MPSAILSPPRYLRANPAWSPEDRWGAVRCRIGSYRNRYSVPQGLYAMGSPGFDSPVFASANYKLSFDTLRRELGGIDGWILVLDTKGINVWCAAGKGTFGTEELVERIEATRLAEVVRHRTIILPQLSAPGIRAHVVEQRTGFRVRFGPVRARDLPAYMSAGMKASPEMRRVRFGIAERLTLAPMELSQSLMRYPAFLLAAFVIMGVTPAGIVFSRGWTNGLPLFALGLASILCGSFLAPVLLPFIPFRLFSVKGWILGAAGTAALQNGLGLAAGMDPFLIAACYLFFPAASAYMALNFTGATTFTSPSGVNREIRVMLPFYIAAGVLSVAALVLSKLKEWSLL
jgi:hypothetical protein